MAHLSDVLICNRAFTLVGGETITALDEVSTAPEPRMAFLHYESLRDEVMAAGDWSFARARVGPLAAEVTPPISGYEYQFLLPADCLVVRYVSRDPRDRYQLDRWAKEGDYLLADIADNLYAKYTARIEDPNKFSPPFAGALVLRLAAEFAIPLANSRSLRQELMAEYDDALMEAFPIDAVQGRNERIQATRLRKARFGVGPGESFYDVDV